MNRLIFFFSLLGLEVSSFLFYEYSLSGPVACPIGGGCDVVRASIYANFLGVSIPIWGVVFYLAMATLSVFRFTTWQFLLALAGFAFGVYLTFLEIFIIQAICFWCILSFIISSIILLCILKLKFWE